MFIPIRLRRTKKFNASQLCDVPDIKDFQLSPRGNGAINRTLGCVACSPGFDSATSKCFISSKCFHLLKDFGKYLILKLVRVSALRKKNKYVI